MAMTFFCAFAGRYTVAVGGPAVVCERLFVDSPDSFVCMLLFSDTSSELSAPLATVVLLLPPPMHLLDISISEDMFSRFSFPTEPPPEEWGMFRYSLMTLNIVLRTKLLKVTFGW